MSIKRRRFIGWSVVVTAAAATSPLLQGHTPYSQWMVYRKKHLLIGCHRRDETTYTLAQRTVAHLGEHLPDARSRVARAPGTGRLASLLGTDQLHVAILSYEDATAMRAGSGSFKPYGKVPVQSLRPMSDRHVLVAHESFPLHHAWLVAEALSDLDSFASSSLPSSAGLPRHPGADLYVKGEPNPGKSIDAPQVPHQHPPGEDG